MKNQKKEISKTFANIGVEVSFDSDKDLKSYKRGNPMTMGELRCLKTGDIVWVYIFSVQNKD